MSNPLADVVIDALENVKAEDIAVLDVTELTDVTDTLIVASGNSSRQIKALANSVVEDCKKAGHQPLGVEGEDGSDWILVDLGDVVVHIMLPETRSFYDLEKLWAVRPDDIKRR